MKDRFPRTPAEFEEASRVVAVRCICGRGAPDLWIKPESLIQRLGRDFDLYEGFVELRDAFPCLTCNQPGHVTFTPVFPHRMFEAVPFEESVTVTLELRAFALARDAADLGISQQELRERAWKGVQGRVRKFGVRRR